MFLRIHRHEPARQWIHPACPQVVQPEVGIEELPTIQVRVGSGTCFVQLISISVVLVGVRDLLRCGSSSIAQVVEAVIDVDLASKRYHRSRLNHPSQTWATRLFSKSATDANARAIGSDILALNFR
jgi:hypothetical protein